MAIANENASRPQPRSNDSGARNWPSAERGPNAISAMTQPTAISTIGVRHDASFNGAGAATVDMGASRENRRGTCRAGCDHLGTGSRGPKRNFVMVSICAADDCMADPRAAPPSGARSRRGPCHSARGVRTNTREGAGAAALEVLSIVLEMRITGLEMPAVQPDVFVPIYAQIEHICPITKVRRLPCRLWKQWGRSMRGNRCRRLLRQEARRFAGSVPSPRLTSNGTRRSSATPRIFTRASATSCPRSSGRSLRPTCARSTR